MEVTSLQHHQETPPLNIEAKMIDVTFNSERKLVRALIGGLLTITDLDRFSLEKQEAVRAMGLASGEFFLLVEARDNVLQSKEVVAAFQHLTLHSPLKAKRIAIVRSGALSTLQSRRIAAVRQSAQVFESSEDAQAWLFS
jgi:hypothetical protein